MIKEVSLMLTVAMELASAAKYKSPAREILELLLRFSVADELAFQPMTPSPGAVRLELPPKVTTCVARIPGGCSKYPAEKPPPVI